MSYKTGTDRTTIWVVSITVILTILIIVLAYFYGGDKEVATGAKRPTSQLTTIEKDYDFGSISMAKGKVSKVFTVENNTASSIELKKLYTSCMCTKATLSAAGKIFGPFSMPAHGFIPSIDLNLLPGEKASVEAVFDPAAHGPAGVGPIGRNVILETNEGQVVFSFKANVTP